MSLSISGLSKRYGRQWALEDVSFSLSDGEIVGFLGPNGAGKSTTMKIATGYIAATSGTVLVGGVDVASDPIAVKRSIGYLPEHNPLYTEMFVHEYLRFVAGLYGIHGTRARSRVEAMIEQCGLAPEQNKRIETLSKGYRQRVGLAQALIHDPSVLILDEPTSGLDPNQIVEIRNLIRNVSTAKTVLFSSHIMQEVQSLCKRVVVINKGKIVADQLLEKLLHEERASVNLIVEFEGGVAAEDLRQLPGVAAITEQGHFRFKIMAQGHTDLRPVLFRFAAEKNLSLIGLRQEESSLEEVFRDLTTESDS